MKITAIAHPMQALLKDWELRIPFHDSISVNIDALWTRTTVEFGDFEQEVIIMNGMRELAGIEDDVRVESENSISYDEAKGLGFSSSGGAALTAALFKASHLDEKYGWDLKLISRMARRLAGSAARSVVGEYARLYAGDDESSYAEKIASKADLDMRMVIVPISSDIRTEEAHYDVMTSPSLTARLEKVAMLAEIDSLELHGLTMTGKHGLVAYKPESIAVMSEIRRMRQDGMEAYFSMQTGPSVFINTYPECVQDIKERIESLGLKTILAGVGGEVKIV